MKPGVLAGRYGVTHLPAKTLGFIKFTIFRIRDEG
jgi:hypothetical protein